MRRSNLYPVDGAAFLLGVGSPQHEDNPVQVLVEPGHHHIGELLPASLLVGGGLVSSHREDGVEQEHPWRTNKAEGQTVKQNRALTAFSCFP